MLYNSGLRMKQGFFMGYNKNGLFSVRPIITPIILIAIAIGVYYYIDTHYLFPKWLYTIYIIMKCFVALQIIVGSARSLLMPILALLAGAGLLFLIQKHGFVLVSTLTAWQLMITAMVGFVVSMVIIK